MPAVEAWLTLEEWEARLHLCIQPPARWVALVPDAWQVVATESGHNIQPNQPDLVIAAVQQVLSGT